MNEARWQQAVALFERALERPVEERDRFLEQATGTDHELRSRVAAMLRADGSAHAILDGARGGLADSFSPTPVPTLEGRSIGPYVVVREIGRGGMATVYLASDAKHRRSVALKLLHADASSALGGERFRREITVVAQLQHPHILPLYDSGETDGLLYYVMPLVSGETLRERIARQGPLPIDDVCRIAGDVGAALDYAHRQGVVHRDIKPANILLDAEHASVADFGIAHQLLDDPSEQLTSTGVVIGTPAYMSPEQALGVRAVDARTDVYALGCVAFEMLAGEPPFRAATTPALVTKHVHAPVPSVVAARPGLAPVADEVLAKALAKDPADRYASAREFVQAFDAALRAAPSAASAAPSAAPRALVGAGAAARLVDRDGSAEGHAPPAPTGGPGGRRVGRRTLAATLGAIVVISALAGWIISRRAVEPPSIAVLPFVNMSGDPANEYFSDGVTEEITGALAQLGRIRVTPRTTAFGYKGRTGDLRRIGDELGVTRILEGSVRRDAGQVLVHARLYDAATGDPLWTNRYERDWRSVLSLQTEIAGTIVEQLQLNLLPGERTMLAGRHTANADAYDSYLRGRHFFDLRTAASLEQAAVHFRRALQIDSTYARAQAGLADTYSILAWTGGAAPNELFMRADSAARRALALDSTLAEPHLSLGLIHTFHTWNWEAAERAIARAIAVDSTHAQAWFWRVWPLVVLGRPDDAMVAMRRARELDPLSLITNARIGTLLAWAGRYEAADSALRRTLEIDPSYPVARVQLARVLSIQGRHADAVAMLPSDSVRLGSYESGIAGFVYARAGRRDSAITAARRLEARPYVPAEGVAAIYAGLGDRDRALGWLERAVESRGPGLIFLSVEPMYDSLRGDPRYQRVVARVGLGNPGRGRADERSAPSRFER